MLRVLFVYSPTITNETVIYMEQKQISTVKTHVVWLDVVRLIAMFTVVCCHCTDPFNFYPGDSPIIGDIKFWGAAYGAFLRPCVPLFVMITGALLLPVREETSIFYKKRILRVFWPFLIWSVIYNLFPWFTGIEDKKRRKENEGNRLIVRNECPLVALSAG